MASDGKENAAAVDVPHYTPDYKGAWNDAHVEVEGSYGIFLVERATGTILKADYYGCDDYRNILRFDPATITGHMDFIHVGLWSIQPDGSELYEPGNPIEDQAA